MSIVFDKKAHLPDIRRQRAMTNKCWNCGQGAIDGIEISYKCIEAQCNNCPDPPSSKQTDMSNYCWDLHKERDLPFFNHYRIVGVEPTFAQSLMTGWPNVNPKDMQNSSPTQKQLVYLASHYNGTLEGYVIMASSKRVDSRITFDGITIQTTKHKAKKLQSDYEADEFDQIDEQTFRFWWD